MTVKAEIENGTIAVHSQFRDKELVKQLAGARWDKNQSIWHVPLSWASCKALRGVFGDELEIGPTLWQWAAECSRLHVEPMTNLRGADDWVGDEDLRHYQRVGVAFLTGDIERLGVTDPDVVRAFDLGGKTLGDDMGTGKASRNGTPVLTPAGWRLIETLAPGDTVVARDGSPTRVLGVFPQGEVDVYRVTFSDRTSTEVSGEHLWAVRTPTQKMRDAGWQTKQTRDLMGDLHVKNGGRKWHIPLVDPIQFPTADLPLHPYALGALLGDGGVTYGATISGHADDIQVLDAVAKLADWTYRDEQRGNVVTRHFYEPARSQLRELGLLGKRSYEKRVPEAYLCGDVEQRLELLRGLMDTDGGIANRTGTSVEFSTTSEGLAHDVIDLVRSLGGLPSLTSRETHYTKDGLRHEGRTAYRVVFSLSVCPFALDRKAFVWRPCEQRPATRSIESIEFAGRDQATCIMVEDAEHLYIVNDYIVTHNTVMGARALRKVYQTLGPEAAFPALIVCPNTVKGQPGRDKGWYGELERWFPEARVGVIRGNITQRRKVLKQLQDGELDIAIINWENLRNHSRLAAYGSVRLGTCEVCDPTNPKKQTSCERCPRELNAVPFRAVIADEAHRAKDPKSKQTRALKAIMHQPNVLWRWALSGTITGDSMDEAWSPMNAIAPNEYPSRTKYIDRYALQSWNAFGGMDVIGLRSDTRDEFYSFFDPRFLRRPRQYALRDLKDPQYTERMIELTPKQKKLYRELADEMVGRLDDGDLMLATNPLTQTARLNQAAASYMERTDCSKCDGSGKRAEWHLAAPHPDPAYADTYCWCSARMDDDKTHDERCKTCNGAGFIFTLTAPSNKVDELVTMLKDEMHTEQVVVFAVSRQLIELAAAALDKANIPAMQITGAVPENVRYANVDAFRRGEYRVALVVIQAGGEGLDGLQVAQTGIFLQRHYSLLMNQQAEGRLLRSGQEGQVAFIDLRSEGTIEEDKELILAGKEDRSQEVMRDAETLRRLLAIRP